MKRITASVLALLLILCGCGQKSVSEKEHSESIPAATMETPESNNDTGSVIDTDSAGDTDSAVSKSSDTDTAKKRKSDSDSDVTKKKGKSSEKSSDSDKDTDTSKSKASSSKAADSSNGSSTQTYTYTVGGADDPIRNVAPENVQQYIIEEPTIVTEPEPESTYVNEYENVDPKEKVDDSWFDDCVIIGDSLTVGLSMYNDANGTFSDAKFVCASSLSYWNSQWDLYAPNNVHPYYNGRKVLVEDAAVLTGAKKAIITLGMNDIGIWGPEGAIEQARSLLAKIRAKSPELRIYLQTVTPMIYSRQKAHLNNELIRQFDNNLRNFAAEQGCGFLNSYDAFADSNGNLPYNLCSDPGGLGLHFNFAACEIWSEFIKSNIGSAYPEPEPEPEPSSIPESDVDTDSNTQPVADTDSVTESVVSE